MAHKIKLDEDGEPIYDNERDRKYAEMRELYRYVPEKIFKKAFNRLWGESGMDFDGYDLDNAMSEDLNRLEDRALLGETERLKP